MRKHTLDTLIEIGLRHKQLAPKQCKIETVVSEIDLQRFSAAEILAQSVKYNLMLPMCCQCSAVRPNGKWIPPSDYTRTLKQKYRPISFGYCPTCEEKLYEEH